MLERSEDVQKIYEAVTERGMHYTKDISSFYGMDIPYVSHTLGNLWRRGLISKVKQSDINRYDGPVRSENISKPALSIGLIEKIPCLNCANSSDCSGDGNSRYSGTNCMYVPTDGQENRSETYMMPDGLVKYLLEEFRQKKSK